MTHPQGPGQFRAKKAKKWVVAPFWKIPTPPPSWLECSSHLSAQETTQPIKTNHLVFQGPLSSSGFPGGASGKESAFQCRRYRRQFRSLSQEDPLEKEMAICSSILAWGIPWTEEPGSLQSMGSQESDTIATKTTITIEDE